MRIVLLGDGGWGTAIAVLLARHGQSSTLWGHDPAYLDEMRHLGENRLFLPGVPLPPAVTFEADLRRAVGGADLLLVAVPTKFLRSALAPARGLLPAGAAVASLVKGIEPQTLLRPSEMLRDLLGVPAVGVVSGPSHAEEVARGLPATLVAASADGGEIARRAQAGLMGPTLRVYTSQDPVGVELGGALKNVIALAAGICSGLGLGDNAMAALMTRGLAEITRLGVALGADARTFAGLSGMGDLVTTCISPHGRNRRVGLALGRGERLADILAASPQVAEGVTTAASALALGRRAGVELPILREVCAILHEGKSPREAVQDLMMREGKAE